MDIDTLVRALALAYALSFVGLCVCLAILMHSVRVQLRRGALRARTVLTRNEHVFLRTLVRALPEFEVWPQVAMGALLQVRLPEADPEYWNFRRLFAGKIVDFVVSRRGSSSFVVVELDDRTHNKNRDRQRDALLARAGISTVRFASYPRPDVREIRNRLAAVK